MGNLMLSLVIRTVLPAIAVIFFIPSASPAAVDAKKQVRIGVLAYRGADMARKMWTPTAEYLTGRVSDSSFSIVPLGFDEINETVRRGDVEFVIANSSIYSELEILYGANRIATIKNRGKPGSDTSFGGVIFCKAGRNDIKNLNDLKGKKFYAVDESSLGGWQVAWRELKDSGINPNRDFLKLYFTRTHDAVVYAVRDGVADAGTVRTDVLENMANENKIRLSDFTILNPQKIGDFPYLLSTRLYPEWPIAKLTHTSEELAEKVSVALLTMKHNSETAKAANISGWTVPAIYQPVRDLQRELGLGPYQNSGRVTISEAVTQHWQIVAFVMLLIASLAAATAAVARSNRRIKQSRLLVEESRNLLETRVEERTSDLIKVNEALVHEILERKQTEEALKQNEKHLRDITATLGEGLYVLSNNEHVTFVNPAAEKMLGWTEAELIGQDFHKIIHSHRTDDTLLSSGDCPINAVIRSGQRFISRDEVFIRKDGTVFPVSIISTPIMNNGVAAGSVTSFLDISSAKEAEAEREELIENLQKALTEIKTLQGVLPICSYCKKIRDDEGAWNNLESYISRHTDAQFSHGICNECAKSIYPEIFPNENQQH